MSEISRRAALGAAMLGAVAASACASKGTAMMIAPKPPGATPETLARDEAWWSTVAAQYDMTDEIIQLENANWGVMSKPVLAAYEQKVAMVNRRNSFYQRREYHPEMAGIAERTARLLGVSADEIVFTRGATEALQALIGGYNRLRPGDAVLYSDHDYDSMVTAMTWLKARRGVDVVSINLPEPATRQSLVDAYTAALDANPSVRMVLLTHVCHRNGLMIPVADIADMARARGVDVIVDAAHSFGQADFSLPDLKSDFIGVNLHKWIGAPIGVGVMYVRRERIPDIDPFMGEAEAHAHDIKARIHSGTVNFAAFITVPETIDFHDSIGLQNKAARVRYLRDQWAEPLRAHPRVEVLTPADPSLHAGITSFRLKGVTSAEANIALAKRLLDEFGIFTVHRVGLAGGACIRTAPAYFNSLADVEALRAAVLKVAESA